MPELSLAGFADTVDEIMFDMVKAFIKRQPDELLKGKITMPQCFLMMFLKRQGEAKMTDIARFLNVTTAAATGVVDRLVKGAHLTRVFDPSDRRIIKVKLSAKGAQTVQKIVQQRRQMIMEIFGKISQDDREQYLAILSRVQQVAKEQGGGSSAHA
jgi:DNA-binding MarR family transcriptional regulator